MKKFFIFAMMFAGALLLGCFDDDPFANAGNGGANVTGGSGAITGISYPGAAFGSNPDGYAAVSQVSFPVTLSVSFTGFVDGQGQAVTEPITRMCVLYFSTAGRWVILKDIRNPQFRVVGSADEMRTLFGQGVIPSAMGYRTTDIIPVLVYFSTANYSNFNLATVLASNSRAILPAQTIGLKPSGNYKPY